MWVVPKDFAIVEKFVAKQRGDLGKFQLTNGVRVSGKVLGIDGQPIAGSFPTSQWRRGDIVYDRHSLDLPANLVPDRYHLVAGLYRHDTLKRLEALTANGRAESDEVTVGELSVTSP